MLGGGGAVEVGDGVFEAGEGAAVDEVFPVVGEMGVVLRGPVFGHGAREVGFVVVLGVRVVAWEVWHDGVGRFWVSCLELGDWECLVKSGLDGCVCRSSSGSTLCSGLLLEGLYSHQDSVVVFFNKPYLRRVNKE